MSITLPDRLFRTKRGLCPNCGAPLPIDTASASTTCHFCGQKAVLERRLRKVEPEVTGAPLRLYFDGESAEAERKPAEAPWVRSKQYRQGDLARSLCPGCGDELSYTDDLDVITCSSCGTDCRLEARLRAPEPDPAREVPRPRHPDERGHECPDDQDPETEHLIYRIVNETDLDTRIILAHRLEENWCYVNKTAARLLPALLRTIRGADPRLQYVTCQLICKLLCEGSQELRNAAVQACERFIFDVNAPRPLIFELGMGDGVCLKPLLDAAEYGVRKGDFEFASACLIGVNWIFQRRFEDHKIMGDIILYRMLYLTGPTLAFAFLLAQRQVTGTGFHYSHETLLSFIDDVAVERPTLVPEIDRSFYVGWPKDEGECRGRLDCYRQLQTDESRASALRHCLMLPENSPEHLAKHLIDFLKPLLDHPKLADPAALALERVFDRSPLPQSAHELVKERGDSLPSEVRRSYLQQVPDTPHLSRDKLPYWQSRSDGQLSPEMQQVRDQWNQGLAAADDRYKVIRDAYMEHWQTLKERDIPTFDGKSDGPAPVKEEELEEPIETDPDKEVEFDESDATDESEAEEASDEASEVETESDDFPSEEMPPFPDQPPGLTPEQVGIWNQSKAAYIQAWNQSQQQMREFQKQIAEDKRKRRR